MPAVRVIQATEQQKKKIRVCAYVRVSSDSADQLNSFSNQAGAFLTYIQSNPEWEFVHIYADEGITRTRADKREELQQMIADCKAGKIDRVLVKSVSRFARNASECLQIVRELKEYQVSVLFEKENIDTEKITSELILSLRSAYAQQESISLSQNLRKGIRMRMENGTYKLSNASYGYRLDGAGKLVAEPEEAKIVQQVFTMYLSGKSIQGIADDMNKNKVPKNNLNQQWSFDGVRYILTNERYIGDTLLKKSHTSEFLPFKKSLNKGKEKQYYTTGTHSAIVSREQFERVQQLMKSKNTGIEKTKKCYYFTGTLRCENCGEYFHRKARGNLVEWICWNHKNNKELCTNHALNEQHLCQAILKMCNKLHQNPQILDGFIRQLQQLYDRELLSQPDVLMLNKEIAELMEQNHALNRLRSKECIDPAFFVSQSRELNQQVAKRKEQLKQYQNHDYKRMIQDTKHILHVLEQRGIQYEFDEIVCTELIAQITVAEDQLRFRLINGLEFSEHR